MDNVCFPRAEDIIYCDEEKCQKHQQFPAVFNDENETQKHIHGQRCYSQNKWRGPLPLQKIWPLPKHAQANHRILVYRFRNKEGKLIEGSIDDKEFGAGRNLLKHLEEWDYKNIICVVSRWYGGEHLETTRFDQVKEVVDQVSQKFWI